MSVFTTKDIGHIFAQLWRSKWIILFITLAGLLAGMAATTDDEPDIRYRATSSVCVTYTTYQEQMRGSSVITSYSDLVTSSLVCGRAAEMLADTGVLTSQIQRMIENSVSGNSYVMFINATAQEPQLAIRVVNAVAQAFIEEVSTVSGNNSLQILDVAYTTTTLASAVSSKVIIAALAPFCVVCAWIILREIFEGKVRFISQCAADQGELFGILPDIDQGRPR